jgi:DNA repair exonuclease SbcCD ATPase subunit
MNLASLETFLDKNFQVVEHRKSERIITAHLIRRECVVAMYFFDYSEHILEPGFNLSTFQEDNIAKEYYKQSSWLQWNMNLIFVMTPEHFHNIAGSPTQISIEADRLYCRKHICSVTDLDSLFPLSKPIFSDSQGMSSDLTSRWHEKLAGAGLHDVLSEAPFAQVIREIIEPPSDKVPSPQIDLSTRDVSDNAGLKVQLDRLDIRNFRVKPSHKAYKLGMVNIICGPNGVGKTSFLEAIELCLCGRTFRGGAQLGSDIAYWVRGLGQSLTLALDDNRLYQSRDLRWYNNRYSRGNNLSHSFNKFNFYDTDQAYRLSYKTDPNEIRSAFASLALGERVNFFDERIRRVRHELGDELIRRQARIKALEAQIQQNELEIKELSLGLPPPEPILEVLTNDLRRILWKGSIPLENDNNLSTIEAPLLDARSKLRELMQILNPWVSPLSKKAIADVDTKLSKVLSKVAELEARIENSSKSGNATQTAINGKLRTVELLKRALEYARIGPWNRFSGVDERIAKLENTLTRLDVVLQLISDCDTTLFQDNHTPVLTYVQQLTSKCEAFQAELDRMSKAINNLRKTLDHLGQLSSDLRRIGLEIISLKPDSEECPLCHANHPKGELKVHVEQVDSRLATLPDLEKLNAQYSKLTTNLKDARQLLDSARMIQRAIREYSSAPNSDRVDFVAAIASLKGILPAREIAANEHGREVAFRQSLAAKRLSEDDLRTIAADLTEMKDGFQLHLQTEESLSVQLNNLNEEILTLRQELTKHGAERQRDQQALLTLCQDVLIEETDTQKSLLIIRSRSTACRRAIGNLQDIEQAIDVSDDMILTDLLNVTERALGYLGKLNQLRTEAQSRTKALQFRSNAVATLKAQHLAESEPLRRIKNALEPLEYIVQHDNKEQALETFFAAYRDRILQIFRTMHSPREFDDIMISDSTVTLRNLNGNISGLNNISTGQRAALALSIFLSLNASLQDGPSMILIDDAVANVDDINCVAFLDFLREFAVTRKRQLFFATANTRLANLFTKKFSFLGDEFVNITL